MTKTNKVYLLLLALVATFSSCKDIELSKKSTYRNGYFIVNEGGIGNSNGSISFYDTDSLRVFNNVFNLANGLPLGDVVQSMSIFNESGYIVVNNSKKMEVIDSEFLSVATIENLDLPRYFAGVSATKGYVSDWGSYDGSISSYVAVVDLQANQITKRIDIGSFQGVEDIVVSNSKAYVSHNFDSKISVIDTEKDAVTTTIDVGTAPAQMSFDSNGKLWVICAGSLGADWIAGTADDVVGKLMKINPNGNTIELDLEFPFGVHPSKMELSGDNLYYLTTSGVFKFDITASSLPTTFEVEGSFYGIGVNPNGKLLTGSYDFSTSSTVKLYGTGGSVPTNSFVSGIGTNGFVFNTFQ